MSGQPSRIGAIAIAAAVLGCTTGTTAPTPTVTGPTTPTSPIVTSVAPPAAATTLATAPTPAAATTPGPATTLATATTGATAPSSPPTASTGPSHGPTATATRAEAADTTARKIVVEPGPDATSVDAQPEEENVVDADGADGSTFRLDIPAYALTAPTRISLRPLARGTIPGGKLVAGVDIEPAGLRLQLPATLTITPAGDVDPETSVSLEYRGTGSASAVLGAVAAGTQPGILLTHFSGGAVASLDGGGESLWLENGTFNTDTAAGRQAQAEHAIRVIEWSEQQGRIEHDAAVSSERPWRQQWWEAEVDILKSDPELKSAIASGDPAQAGVVELELSNMVKAALEVGKAGGEDAAAVAITQAIALEGTFVRNLIGRLEQDPDFQGKLDSGLVSNMDDVRAVLDTVLAIDRQLGIIGDSATSDVIGQAVATWIKKFIASVLESCKHAPLSPEMAAGFIRMATFYGDPSGATALSDCVWEDFHFRIDGRYADTRETEQITLEGKIAADFIRLDEPGRERHFIGWSISYSLVVHDPRHEICSGCIESCMQLVPDAWTGIDSATVEDRRPGHVRIHLLPDPVRLGDQSKPCWNALGGPYVSYSSFTLELDLDEHGVVDAIVRDPTPYNKVTVTILPPTTHD